MILLISGVLIWSLVHLFKRISPTSRAMLDTKFGKGPVMGVISLIFLISIAMMVFGFRGAEFQPLYKPPVWGVHLNNLMMLIALFLMGAGSSKGTARAWFRHPMLIGFLVWVGAHLLVNGDLSSFILFGGLGIWAIVSILMINMREGAWQRPTPGPVKGDIKLGIIALVLFAVITTIHYFIGPSPFGG
ncbi:MAG: NnrU family protein [Paracoccaceae bacterium]